MTRLRAPFTVFATLSRPCVDDAARVERRFSEVAGDFARRLVQRLLIGGVRQPQRLLVSQGLSARQDALFQFFQRIHYYISFLNDSIQFYWIIPAPA
jgi:hypothetical protein